MRHVSLYNFNDMSNVRKTIVEWFGYTRKERRGSVILLILIFITLIAKHILVNDHSDNYLTSSYVQIPVMEDADIVIYDSVIEKREQTKTVIKREIVELNSCDSAALEALPGIGPVLSARIIRYRNLLGGFYDVGQLREVYGLSEETFSLIEGRVRVDTSLVQRVSVNFAEYGTLLRMPYLEKEDVDNIMRYKRIKGKISSMAELVDDEVISSSTAKKISCYFEFEE